jgi:hypothetical protein
MSLASQTSRADPLPPWYGIGTIPLHQANTKNVAFPLDFPSSPLHDECTHTWPGEKTQVRVPGRKLTRQCLIIPLSLPLLSYPIPQAVSELRHLFFGCALCIRFRADFAIRTSQNGWPQTCSYDARAPALLVFTRFVCRRSTLIFATVCRGLPSDATKP